VAHSTVGECGSANLGGRVDGDETTLISNFRLDTVLVWLECRSNCLGKASMHRSRSGSGRCLANIEQELMSRPSKHRMGSMMVVFRIDLLLQRLLRRLLEVS
jgi:hypothetical protein